MRNEFLCENITNLSYTIMLKNETWNVHRQNIVYNKNLDLYNTGLQLYFDVTLAILLVKLDK